jgi:hypothetical protein
VLQQVEGEHRIPFGTRTPPSKAHQRERQ